jgi:hypothetical protein
MLLYFEVVRDPTLHTVGRLGPLAEILPPVTWRNTVISQLCPRFFLREVRFSCELENYTAQFRLNGSLVSSLKKKTELKSR